MRRARHDCRPPAHATYHVMGTVARKLTPGELLMIAGPGDPKLNMFLAPGDTWRCTCGRRWLYTLNGWRRRFNPRYLGMAFGKQWTPDLLGRWETIRAQVTGRPDRPV